MKTLFASLTILFVVLLVQATPKKPLITKWEIKPNNLNLKLSINSGTTYSYSYVNENNPTQKDSSRVSGNLNITLPSAGQYTIKFYSEDPFKLNNLNSKNPQEHYLSRLLEISQWGDINWDSDLSNAFLGAKQMQFTATDIPNFSNVTNMDYLFNFAKKFNSPINTWDVSKVKSMRYMFYEATDFNQPLDQWNVSNVENMVGAFYNAKAFNQPINSWNVSKVTKISGLFSGASSFNQPLDRWNLENVTEMYNMFYYAKAFNQPLDQWNLKNVYATDGIFNGAQSFKNAPPHYNNNLINAAKASRLTTQAYEDCPLTNAITTKWSIPSNNFTLTIPIPQNTNYSYYIENESGNNQSNTGNLTYTFNLAGTYTIYFGDTDGTFKLNNSDTNNLNLLVEISSWGNMIWPTDMSYAFANSPNLVVTASELPNFSNVINMDYMFSNSSFNTTVSNWNVSQVTTMQGMFKNATSFNQPLTSWDTEAVVNFNEMFSGASAFNQNISDLDYKSMTNAVSFLNNSGLNCINYSSLLYNLSQQNNLKANVTFGASGLKFGATAQVARTYLINTKTWIITDTNTVDTTCNDAFLSTSDNLNILTDKVIVYPNPIENLLQIQSKNKTKKVTIYSIDGKLLHSQNDASVNMTSFSKGIYIIKIVFENNKTHTQKIIKK